MKVRKLDEPFFRCDECSAVATKAIDFSWRKTTTVYLCNKCIKSLSKIGGK